MRPSWHLVWLWPWNQKSIESLPLKPLSLSLSLLWGCAFFVRRELPFSEDKPAAGGANVGARSVRVSSSQGADFPSSSLLPLRGSS